jgi:hypothetical protein
MAYTVNNDFHSPRAIFELFEGLSVEGLEEVPTIEATANGVHQPAPGTETNGTAAVAATA